jgi:AcrR family transcriptional regulator
VAAEAGINEGLLYRHFRSKDELFEIAVAAPLEAAIAALVEASGEPPEEFDGTAEVMRDRTRQFIEDLLGVMEEIAPLLGIVLFGEAEAASSYYRTRLAPALEKVEEIVVAHQAAWAHDDFDPELVVQLVFGMAWFLTLSDRFGTRQRDRAETAEMITRIMIDGLAQRPA